MADLNTYVSGQCTWWCKQKASWWPNGAGNAAEWWGFAQQRGYKTTQTPQTGAIAVWGPGIDPPWGFGHCGLVTATRPDGSFTVSEMNWKGTGVVDSRNVGDRSNLLGFILPPGAQADGSGDASGIGGAIQQAGSQIISAGQVAGGGLLVLAGLVLAVLLVARPGPLRG